jgi:hypothetical protein
MCEINITNLVMLIVTMVRFIMEKQTMTQLIVVKLIMLYQLLWLNLPRLNQLLLT